MRRQQSEQGRAAEMKLVPRQIEVEPMPTEEPSLPTIEMGNGDGDNPIVAQQSRNLFDGFGWVGRVLEHVPDPNPIEDPEGVGGLAACLAKK